MNPCEFNFLTLKLKIMTWSEIASQIKAWQANNPNQPKCFLITAGDISQINAQLASGMNALKVYLGQDPHGIISAFFIGCISDGGGFSDYNIPSNQTAWNNAINSGTLPLKKEGLPCPTQCGAINYLNS
jgi:hypothetical protein